MIFASSDISQLETRYRANFINSLGGFKSVTLIGTKSVQGNENLAVFSSLFHLGANPALCGIIIRPNEEKQNTLGNIMATKHYTINHIMPSFYKEAHQCSAKYEEGISEFSAVGLAAAYVDGIVAPFVQQSRIKFACELVQKIDIELNGTYLVIGKIIKIIVPDEYIRKDGFIDLQKAETITCSGLDSYHTTMALARLSYAKVDQPVQEI
ncbi:MAG: flavin reductase [Chitinophagaceae bacterium]|nr:flavin reductase [Chitinophagaceae bacterium]